MHLSDTDITTLLAVSEKFGIEAAVVGAVIAVESGGLSSVGTSRLPLIRWEGHYFYHFLKGEQRERAVREGLASPTPGAVKNPSSYVQRYSMLRQAVSIDVNAAYASVSIGIGQIMGAHYGALEYTSPRAMFEAACTGFEAQVLQLLLFIQGQGLSDELRRHDWSAFARAYNGPHYIQNEYHIQLAREFKKLSCDNRIAVSTPFRPIRSAAATMLRLGSVGARVRELQQLLVRAGESVSVDGDFGPATKKAVARFQQSAGLTVDGIAGPKTSLALSTYRHPAEQPLGRPSILNAKETAAGSIGSIGGLGTVAVADKLEDTAGKIAETSASLGWLIIALYMAGVFLVLGGILWSCYGWLKARRTYVA